MRDSLPGNGPYAAGWFSTSSKEADSARGRATAAARLELASLQAQAARRVVDFWRAKGLASTAAGAASPPTGPDSPGAAPPVAAKVLRLRVLLGSETPVRGHHPMRQHVQAEVRSALARFGERVTRVEAHLADIDGPARSGADQIRCTLQASLAGLEPVVATGEAANAHQAIHGAVAKLKRAVGSALARHDPRRNAAPTIEPPAGPDAAAV